MAQKSRTETSPGARSRIWKKAGGHSESPKLAGYRTLKHIYAQVIDDESGKTIVTASTVEKDLAGTSGGNVEAATRVGKAIAERAMAAGISTVVFERGGYVFHGRVKALIEASRAGGLNQGEAKAASAE